MSLEITRDQKQNITFSDQELLVTRTVILDQGQVEEKRQEILNYFHKTFSLYESIFECLVDDEAFYRRANPLRHPLIFYYGHTAVFFINKLNVAKLIDTRIDEQIESSLAIGVDEMSWDDLNDTSYVWPTPAKVKDYRDKTRNLVDRFIRTCDLRIPITQNDPLWIVMMGIEHERIHLETTSVLIRELPLEKLQAHRIWSNICKQSGSAPQNELLPVTAGTVTLGKGENNHLYGWDNEYGQKHMDVSGFKASKFLVSNREYLDFVTDGGYQNEKYWTTEGWKWASYRKARHPVFWVEQAGEYRYRSMLSLIDMPWDWPVDVNYLEAKAFCNWKSAKTGKSIRLPTEAEWYRLRALVPEDQPDWEQAPGNINLEREMSSCPVNRHEFAKGFFDLVGNAWQWTETPIDGFEGFRVHPIYDDFSTPTFDGKHNIFKGGCWISTGNYAIRDSRYAFRRHFFQHSGLRYVEADELPANEVNMYETDDIVAQYIEFHYGEEFFSVPNFPVACARICLEHAGKGRTERALDLGCATGRASFELARVFDHVDAIDFSARLIQAPTSLQQKGAQRYTIQDEGELVSYKEIKLSDFDSYENIKDRISFMQGDACNLAAKYTNYDLVFAGNLIDRLYDPLQFLKTIKQRIRPGGLLVLASPYTWLEEFTQRENWLGGFKANTGESYTTLDGLRDTLTPEFEMVCPPRDVPFVIRETRRKFQHSLSEVSVWRKRL
ncbi:5-histidylcysteine sulfoxide synthase [Kiloniella laminariae]|uniref:5-histidylcysteine sulfoxide synthase n=1 Tax=Kiloniella laminariae TaxID=454162 RepID=A0ABT4LDH9_9PROT|nr:5-histidylcysteine sulfoxide synthase [Kiloniella laminariae]MCZ4279164.1 5-histidylcysteine sulfoxide synthase [Kiloniella laminariae]